MEINGRLESDYRQIKDAYYNKADQGYNNRDEAFLKDLYDSIKSLEALGNEYVLNDGKVHTDYALEKIEFAKARWDSAYNYFSEKKKRDKFRLDYNIFKSYEIVRRSGRYNMFDEQAIIMSGLSKKDYTYVMNNYTILNEMHRSKFDREIKEAMNES